MRTTVEAETSHRICVEYGKKSFAYAGAGTLWSTENRRDQAEDHGPGGQRAAGVPEPAEAGAYQRERHGRNCELESHLKLERDHAEVSFRIGRNQKYVVKDIFDWQEISRSQRAFYGKKLDFIHNLETFTEKSLPLA